MAQKVGPIVTNIFNTGGIADSDYVGNANTFAELVGLNIHEESGILKPNQALEKIMEFNNPSFFESIVSCSDGYVYFFNSNNNIIRRIQKNTYQMQQKNFESPLSGEKGVLGAIEFDGFLYFATQNYLHRMAITGNSNFIQTEIESNWEPLHIDQSPLNGLGDNIESRIPLTIIEDDLHKILFTPRNNYLTGIEVYLKRKGAGDLTVTIHDNNNQPVGSPMTINNSQLIENADNHFKLPIQEMVTLNKQYHFHITSTQADPEGNEDYNLSGTTGSMYRNELWSTACRIYSAGDNNYHPMTVQNNTLYIGDRNFIHQVNRESHGHKFTCAALDLPRPHRIKCLGKYGESLLAGTYLSEGINIGGLFRWDTWSVSFNFYDELPEVGVNAFIDADNFVFVSAGVNGNLYSFDGQRAVLMKRVKGKYDIENQSIVYPGATVNFKGLPLIGISSYKGKPCNMGIYSFGRTGANYPFVLNLEYVIPEITEENELRLNDTVIGALAVAGNDLYMGYRYFKNGVWKDCIAVIDYTKKQDKAYFISRIMAFSRDTKKNFSRCCIGYRSLPQDTGIEFSMKSNHQDWEKMDVVHDDVNQLLEARETKPSNTIQFKGVFRSNNNDCVEVEDIRFDQRMKA